MNKATLRAAVIEAIRESGHWMGGAVVVQDGDDYRAYPGAYMSDISFTGSRDVMCEISDPTEVGGPDATAEDAETLAEMVMRGYRPWYADREPPELPY